MGANFLDICSCLNLNADEIEIVISYLAHRIDYTALICFIGDDNAKAVKMYTQSD